MNYMYFVIIMVYIYLMSTLLMPQNEVDYDAIMERATITISDEPDAHILIHIMSPEDEEFEYQFEFKHYDNQLEIYHLLNCAND